MAKRASASTRSISRQEALSYDRTFPNPGNRPRLGVVHLVEINGPGAYRRRYEATRRLLRANPGDGNGMYTAKQRAAMKKMSPARKAAFKNMLASKGGGAPKKTRKRASARKAQSAYASGWERTFGKKKTKKKSRKSAATASRPFYHVGLLQQQRTHKKRKSARKGTNKKRKLTKAERRAISLRNLKKAHAARRGHGRKSTKSRKGRKSARTYGQGKYRALKARYGGRSRWTYKYQTRKGNVRDIPDFALLGYRSAAAMRHAIAKSDKARSRAGSRQEKLSARRERDAGRAAARIRAGKDLFTPNSGETLTFEEWKEMRPNASRKQIAAARRNIKKAQAARRRKRGGRKTAHKRSTARRGKLTKAQRRAISLRNLKKAHAARRGSKRGTRRGTRRSKRGKLTKAQRRAISLRNLAKARAARRGGKKRSRKGKRKGRKFTAKRIVVYAANRRRHRRHYRRNQGAYAVNRGYSANRRKRRHYRRNMGENFMLELQNALKLGALVVVGFGLHRAGTRLLDEYGLSKIDALNTGSVAKWRGLIAGVLAGAAGIGLTVYAAPKSAKAPVAAGMAASLIHGALMTALNEAGQQKAAQMLSAYPDAAGRAYGSYYTFQPHEIYGQSGYGSYYMIPQPGVAGFGNPELYQAAAGYGQPQLTQAAAGYGAPQLTQAAAGMGQAQLTQAAAGTGEYIAYGVSGIGDYDEMPVTLQASHTDEGIHPNLHDAEQALSVAEAAAGVGNADIPLQSTVNPTMIADPIGDLPGGSRAGVFQGGDGIFG